MTDRDTVRAALHDAIDWENSYADSWTDRNAPERIEALAMVERYRALLNRRYGTRDTPMEAALKECTTVTLSELRQRHEKKEPKP